MTPEERLVVDRAVAWAGAYSHARDSETWPEAIALLDAVNALVRAGIVARLPEHLRQLSSKPGADFLAMSDEDVEELFRYDVKESDDDS